MDGFVERISELLLVAPGRERGVAKEELGDRASNIDGRKAISHERSTSRQV